MNQVKWLLMMFYSQIILSLLLYNYTDAYITYIEAKYPLQGEKSPPGAPWPLPQVWIRYPHTFRVNPNPNSSPTTTTRTESTETTTHLRITTNARDCLILEDNISRLSALLNFLNRKNKKSREDTDAAQQLHSRTTNTAKRSTNSSGDTFPTNSFTSPPFSSSSLESSSSSSPSLESLHVQVTHFSNCNYIYPQHNDNEYYEIEIPSKTTADATILADSIWGAIRGLETFSQLVYQSKDDGLLINATKITDWPRFSYRGIMLDSARHFLPKNVLLANLDAMAYNKLNVFHWHIVDDQSFPMESKLFPQLTKEGAFTPRHVYTQDDIVEITEYARYRGIRVIPEIDTPGHTQSFGKAFPLLLTPCFGAGSDKPYTSNYPKHATAEILNPIQNYTYDFMKLLFQEVRYLFRDDYIHLGMDEVYYDCWKSNPDILQFMAQHGMTNMNQVEQYYVRRTIDNVNNLGYKYMVWQDVVDNGVQLANDTIVMVWKEKYRHPNSLSDSWKSSVARIVKQGYKVVVSACWYLNYISYGQDWEKYYRCDPQSFRGTDKEQSMVVGGEACLWGEYVDGSNALPRLWPRASAVAERLWSDPAQTQDVNEARYRLDEQRCRMLQRGIPAQPVLNGYCGDYEWEMDNQL